jgi:hypothetical protein
MAEGPVTVAELKFKLFSAWDPHRARLCTDPTRIRTNPHLKLLPTSWQEGRAVVLSPVWGRV